MNISITSCNYHFLLFFCGENKIYPLSKFQVSSTVLLTTVTVLLLLHELLVSYPKKKSLQKPISRSSFPMLSTGFMVSDLLFKTLTHFHWFCMWYEIIVQFHSFIWGYKVFPKPFIENSILSLLCFLGKFAKDQLAINVEFTSGFSILLHCLFLCQYHTLLITITVSLFVCLILVSGLQNNIMIRHIPLTKW